MIDLWLHIDGTVVIACYQQFSYICERSNRYAIRSENRNPNPSTIKPLPTPQADIDKFAECRIKYDLISMPALMAEHSYRTHPDCWAVVHSSLHIHLVAAAHLAHMPGTAAEAVFVLDVVIHTIAAVHTDSDCADRVLAAEADTIVGRKSLPAGHTDSGVCCIRCAAAAAAAVRTVAALLLAQEVAGIAVVACNQQVVGLECDDPEVEGTGCTYFAERLRNLLLQRHTDLAVVVAVTHTVQGQGLVQTAVHRRPALENVHLPVD